ncbi:unnamed protein product [Ectocarpus sp. CCAP 1310/34]|nr:unnamed protein product [Ectocarpus sp. CCAP 1310/34]
MPRSSASPGAVTYAPDLLAASSNAATAPVLTEAEQVYRITEAIRERGFGNLLGAIAAAPPAPGQSDQSGADGAVFIHAAAAAADATAFPPTVGALFSGPSTVINDVSVANDLASADAENRHLEAHVRAQCPSSVAEAYAELLCAEEAYAALDRAARATDYNLQKRVTADADKLTALQQQRRQMAAAVAAMERELAAAAAACEASTASAKEAKQDGALLRAEASTALAVQRKQVKYTQALPIAPAPANTLPVAEGNTVPAAPATASGANSPCVPAAATAGFQLQEGDFPQLPQVKGKTASPGRRSRTPLELVTVGYVTSAEARERAGGAPALDTAAAATADTAADTAAAATAGVVPPPLRAFRMTDSEKAQLIAQQQEELRGWHERDFEDRAAAAAAEGDGAGGVTAPPTAREVHEAAERAVQRAQAVEVEARGAKWVVRVQQYKKHNAGVTLEEAVHRVWESYVTSFYLYHPDTAPAPPSDPPAWYLGAVAASATSPRHPWAQLEAASPGPPPPERTAAPQPPAPVPVVASPGPRRYQHLRHRASSSSSLQGSPPVARTVAAATPGHSTAVAAATLHRRYQHTRHGPPPSPPLPLLATTTVALDARRPTVSTTPNHGHRATAAAPTNSSHRSTTAAPVNNGHRPNPASTHHGHLPTAAPDNTQRGHIIRHHNLPPCSDRAPAPIYQQSRPTPAPAAAPRARTATPPAAQPRNHVRHTNIPSWPATSAALEADPSLVHDSSHYGPPPPRSTPQDLGGISLPHPPSPRPRQRRWRSPLRHGGRHRGRPQHSSPPWGRGPLRHRG